MLGTPYYFKTTRKITSVVGDLFNDIHIIRTDENGNSTKDIKVPLAYARKQHYYQKLNNNLTDGVSAQSILPRMSFMIESMVRDPARQTNPLHKTYKQNDTNADVFMRMFEPVPYNIDFEVGVFAKNMDDGLQVIEQIIPYFTPEFNLSIITIPELGVIEDVPLIINGVASDDNYEQGFSDNRLIQWSIGFTAKAYFYKPIVDTSIIKKAIVEYKDKSTEELLETQTLAVNPETAFSDDIYTITETII